MPIPRQKKQSFSSHYPGENIYLKVGLPAKLHPTMHPSRFHSG